MGWWSDIRDGALGVGTMGLSGNMDLAGDILTGGAISNAKGVSEANQINIQEAQKNRDFQERLSNTAYGRAMKDMREAGLNPMLAFDKGGASTPSGSQATVQPVRKGDIAAGLANSAKTALQLSAEIPNIKSQTASNTSTAVLNEKKAEVEQANVGAVSANTRQAEAQTKLAQQNLQKAKADTRAARAKATVEEASVPAATKHAEMDAAYAGWDAFMRRLENAAGSVGSALGNARRGWRNGSSPRTRQKPDLETRMPPTWKGKLP